MVREEYGEIRRSRKHRR